MDDGLEMLEDGMKEVRSAILSGLGALHEAGKLKVAQPVLLWRLAVSFAAVMREAGLHRLFQKGRQPPLTALPGLYPVAN